MANHTITSDSSSNLRQELVVSDYSQTPRQSIPTPTTYRERTYQNIDQYGKVYKINSDCRGKVIIFNHEIFRFESQRDGTEMDKNKLKDSFEKLNFTVDIKKDWTSDEIKDFLDTERNNQQLADCDCFIIIVLTHGREDDYLQAADECYEANILWEKFTTNNCPLLKGKPKIFIIQACRGVGNSKGKLPTRQVEADGSGIREANFLYTFPAEEDILVAYSTFQGKKAFRDTKNGTWYIQELCRQLDSRNGTEDILHLLTIVSRHVAVEKEIEADIIYKQMPVIQSTLTRELYLKTSEIDEDIWSRLIPRFDRPADVLPDFCSIYHVSKVVKQFLEDNHKSMTYGTVQDAHMMLIFLSRWPSLNDHMRSLAFRRLSVFINEHKKCRENIETSLKDLS